MFETDLSRFASNFFHHYLSSPVTSVCFGYTWTELGNSQKTQGFCDGFKSTLVIFSATRKKSKRDICASQRDIQTTQLKLTIEMT